MKFLCVSDMIDPLVYSTSLKERYGDVDAIFCAGDLDMEYIDFIVTALNKPTYFVFGNHNLKEFKYYNKKLMAETDLNSNSAINSMTRGHGADYVSNKVLRNKWLTVKNKKGKDTPLLIAGVTGSKRYNNGQAQYTERQMKSQLRHLIPSLIMNKIKYGRYLDVFLTHASPRHIHDREDPCHQGFKCFNWFIKKFSPTLLIHGHIHLYDLQAERSTQVQDTTVVNCYSHIIIELTQGENNVTNVSVHTDR